MKFKYAFSFFAVLFSWGMAHGQYVEQVYNCNAPDAGNCRNIMEIKYGGKFVNSKGKSVSCGIEKFACWAYPSTIEQLNSGKKLPQLKCEYTTNCFDAVNKECGPGNFAVFREGNKDIMYCKELEKLDIMQKSNEENTKNGEQPD